MKHTEWLIHQRPDEFRTRVGVYLEGAEAENGLLLGMLEHLQVSPPADVPFMAELKCGDEILCVAFYRERNLIISRGPDDAWPQLAQKLIERSVEIPGVVGPAHDAERMAAAWSNLKGCKSVLAMDQRLYRLDAVTWPANIPGQARLVADGDVETLTNWIHGFYQDAIPWETPSLDQIREGAIARVPAQMTFFWEVDGVPVTMAALSRPTRRGITVNMVYTPAEHRRHGYATALVAAISSEGLRRGKEFCVLYTDLTNPTSNSIYQKIGYRPVCDSRNFRFNF